MGKDWTQAEMEAAVQQGPHVSSLEPDTITQIQIEVRDKEKQGFVKMYNLSKSMLPPLLMPPPNR